MLENSLTGYRSSASNVADLLRLEAEAIVQAADRLQPAEVERAVELLGACRGKVVVAGIGKSGIVAKKIAATMTSTGTIAVYLHPSDALHGDLGIVTPDDVAVVLSNSGETEELLAMMPYLRRREVPIVAIVGNLRSSLARQATVVLDASVIQEACPFNLAPTTSTTVAMAIGDALAMTLMQLKALTPEDFALNHPAGRLGKRLTLRVADLLGPDNPLLPPEASWLEVVNALGKAGLGAVNIVDREGRLIGIITDGDLRRTLQKIRPTEIEGLVAEAIMTCRPIVTTAEQLAYEALQLMENRPSQISVLPVVDAHGCCVGLLRLHDIIRSGLS